MGNNNIIPFQVFQEMQKVLMERDMPEVLHNRQMEVVFFPETHLHNMPRVVAKQTYQTRIGQFISIYQTNAKLDVSIHAKDRCSTVVL